MRVLTRVDCGFLAFARSSPLPKDTPLLLHAQQPQPSSAASCAVHSLPTFSFVRLFIPSFMPPRSSQQAAPRRAAQARHTRRALVSRVPDQLMPHTAPALPARNTAAQATPRGGSATPPQVPQRTTGTAPAGVSPSAPHTTPQQRNNATQAQQHSNTTTQQRNSTTQQHTMTTTRQYTSTSASTHTHLTPQCPHATSQRSMTRASFPRRWRSRTRRRYTPAEPAARTPSKRQQRPPRRVFRAAIPRPRPRRTRTSPHHLPDTSVTA